MGLKDYVKEIKERPEFRFAFPVAEIARSAGEVLRRLRTASDKTQEEIAKELDMSQPRVSQIESGNVEHLPSLALMVKYAEICGDSICVLPESEYKALVAAASRKRRRFIRPKKHPMLKRPTPGLAAKGTSKAAVRNQARSES